MKRAIVAALATGAAALSIAGPAMAAPPEPGAYQQDDFAGGRAFSIVPPGQNGFESATDVANFLADGTRPPHQYDQNDMYANLVYATPGLKDEQILDYFKDNSFGVEPQNIERTETPQCLITTPPSANNPHCNDVTIVRDQFGVPHVYGQDRAALMFGLGYATGEDRLFLTDALRHAGRADLSSFAGGANVGQDRETFANAPYMNDDELMAQYDRADELYGQKGVQIQLDVQNYTDGINQWIAESRLDPRKLDALYAATGHPNGPDPWKVTDVIATGALVAGIFGKGGGGELEAATALQDAKQVLGKKKGKLVWKDFRSADDPEANRTVHKKVFKYRTPPKGRAKGLALPDPGTVKSVPVVPEAQAASAPVESKEDPGAGLLAGLDQITAGSNALLVSARESETGHPAVVFGPQTGYFAPQLLFEQEAHAPGGPEGPAIDASGVAFTGTNLYVQLGRGRDYSWSATSSGQDIIDTFAVRLCEPDGSEPTRASLNYEFNGECLPMDVLTHTNSWTPNVADQTPPGSETLTTYRTKAGLVSATATIKGKPYAFTKLRATYQHEVDSALSFADWNSPEVVTDAKSWTKAGYTDDLTFNWFYTDSKQIAYYNSGADPVRAKNTHPNFPVLAKQKFMWKDFNPDINTFRRNPIKRHAQIIDQRFLTSWNNKQALGYRCDGIRCYTPVYRSTTLDKKIKSGIKGKKKMSLVELIDAMESAGTTDLRGLTVVPFALRLIKQGGKIRDPNLAEAVKTMKAWVKGGSHRLDRDNDGNYDNADAVRIMDAWWPLWVKRQFQPTLGAKLHDDFIGEGHDIHDAPGAHRIGLPERRLRLRPEGPALDARPQGQGRLLASVLRQGQGEGLPQAPRGHAQEGGRDELRAALRSRGLRAQQRHPGKRADVQRRGQRRGYLTAAPVDEFHWINRPTYQQAVQYPGHR